MGALVNLKNTYDDFSVEFEVLPLVNSETEKDDRRKKISKKLDLIDDLLVENQKLLDELNSNIDKLTNHADEIDYMVAVASGVLSGLIDAFFVDDFSLEKAHELGSEKINNFIVKIAQKKDTKVMIYTVQ